MFLTPFPAHVADPAPCSGSRSRCCCYRCRWCCCCSRYAAHRSYTPLNPGLTEMPRARSAASMPAPSSPSKLPCAATSASAGRPACVSKESMFWRRRTSHGSGDMAYGQRLTWRSGGGICHAGAPKWLAGRVA
eukprot:229099-Chlamydomonas_euryale.AAC.14